jgi:PAS domain S-box-containing protein
VVANHSGLQFVDRTLAETETVVHAATLTRILEDVAMSTVAIAIPGWPGTTRYAPDPGPDALTQSRKSMATRRKMMLYLITFAIFCASSLSSVYGQTNSPKKRVLVLHSYNYGYGWTDSIEKGIESVLPANEYSLYVEYMDSKRIEGEQYFTKLFDLYKYKFFQANFDIIIASDDNAFIFLRAYKSNIFDDFVPIVFCGVNYFRDDDINGRSDITGVVEEYDVKGTIDIINTIHEHLHEIIVISDKTTTGAANTNRVREVFSHFFPGQRYAVWDDLSMPELLEKVSALPAETAVLYLGFARDSTGRNLAPLEESLAVISHESRSPLYSVWEFTLESVVGGMITSGFYQGETAAQMARRILAGESIAAIPVIKQSPNAPMFNYQQMERFGISRTRLPGESRIIYAPATFYPVQKRVVEIATAVLCALLFVVAGLFINIRKRTRAENAAQIEKEKYRMLVKQVPGIVFKGYADYACDCFDEKIEAITGYTQEDFNSRRIKWDDLLLEEYVAPITKQVKKALQGDGFYISEFRIRKKNGEVIWLQARNQVVKNARGRIDYINGVFFDITERKFAEQALRASEERFRLLYEESPVAYQCLDAQGRILEVNNAWLAELGYHRDDIIGRWFGDFLAGDGPALFQPRFQALQAAGAVHGVEYEMKCRDGREIMVSFEARTGRDTAGDLLRTHWVFVNVTARRSLEAQLQQAQKMESVGRLAGGVAHDFNNMLMVIIGHAELAMDQLEPAQPIRAHLQEIHKAAHRSADLTRQLLAFARRQTVSPKVLDLNETVAGMLKMLRRLIGEDIVLSWMPGLEVWPVKVDPAQVDQILANLTVNARDAITGVGIVTIETGNVVFDESYCQIHAGCLPGDYVMLAVSDTGTGMDRTTMEKIFEPFFTTKEVGKGTGLGLSTIYGIVRQNSGFINVYSEPGQGATFKIYVPRAEATVAAVAAAVEEMSVRGSETVLLVEDEEAILDLGKSILEQHGYTVLAARTPQQALALARRRQGPIHLLITDVVMPGMNGRRLQEDLDPIRPGLKVLFMSGYPANAIAHHGVLDDGVQFLQKPFSVRTLVEKVRNVLDASGSLQDERSR